MNNAARTCSMGQAKTLPKASYKVTHSEIICLPLSMSSQRLAHVQIHFINTQEDLEENAWYGICMGGKWNLTHIHHLSQYMICFI